MNLHRNPRSTADATLRDPRWQSVLGRDAAADDRFYYSVSTTGVYCRPSCGARQPRPENVRFHASADAAVAAGFRACRRCRPDQAGQQAQRAAMVAAACRLIEAAEQPLSLDALAAQVGSSSWHFHRIFKAATGITPKAYGDAQRANRVRSELARSGTVTDAIHEAGYQASSRFYERAAGVLGMTPSEFRAGGEHTEIRFAVGQCALGAILVASSAIGICAILIGDDPDALVRELQDQFPRASLIGADAQFEQRIAQVVGLVENPGVGVDLPLDVRGTAFQQRVWQALREIPAGSTASYAEIAARIGAPKSTRAVAQACAANCLAVAIPCHRVVRQDGGLSGYRWGVERKRALLEREAQA